MLSPRALRTWTLILMGGAVAASAVPSGGAAAAASIAPPPAPASASPPPASASPPPAAPAKGVSSGLDLDALDRTVAPCTDLQRFACGGWLAGHPAPPGQPSWSVQQEMSRSVDGQLREILEAAAREDPGRSADQQQAGDDYASCTDEAGITARGLAALDPLLRRIAALRSPAELPAVVAELHRAGAGAFFSFSVGLDPAHAGSSLARLGAGGLALPGRRLYLDQDAAAVELRRQYGDHVARLLSLAGDPAPRAREEAAEVLAVETALAGAAPEPAGPAGPPGPGPADRRLGRPQLEALTPGFDWNAYFGTLGAPAMETVLVAEPDDLAAFGAVLGRGGLDAFRSYLRWQLLHALVRSLPPAFAAEDFAFFGRRLGGAVEPVPRWRSCVAAVEAHLGMALGHLYADRVLSAESRERAADLVRSVEDALASDLTTLRWLSEATKRQALRKLRAIRNRVGHPDRWPDDSGLSIVRGDALGNSLRAGAFAMARRIAAIARPADPDDWPVSPAAVEAAYDPRQNALTLPAGILQPPLFDSGRDAAANFGALGSLIGRELLHGFDDQGRQLDGAGNLRDWWAPSDTRELARRAACFAAESADPGAGDGGGPAGHSALGLEERVANAGGAHLAYLAHHATVAGVPGREGSTLDGFSPEQRFFLAFAQSRCGDGAPRLSEAPRAGDAAAPETALVNGVLANMPELARAFNCPAGAPLLRPATCRVW